MIFIVTSTRAPGKDPESLVSIYSGLRRGEQGRKKTRCYIYDRPQLGVRSACGGFETTYNRPAMITLHGQTVIDLADGQRRLAVWKENGWKRSDGKEVRNLDLWQQIEELLRPHAVLSVSKIWSGIKILMNASEVRQNGRLRDFGDKISG